jgi:hypothetical protein
VLLALVAAASAVLVFATGRSPLWCIALGMAAAGGAYALR